MSWENAVNWWLLGLFVGAWLLSTKRVTDWVWLPMSIALGPLTILVYGFCLIRNRIDPPEGR